MMFHPTDSGKALAASHGGIKYLGRRRRDLAYRDRLPEGGRTLYRSTDGGQTMTSISSGISDVGRDANAPFVLDPNDSRRMLAGGNSLWRTDNVKAARPGMEPDSRRRLLVSKARGAAFQDPYERGRTSRDPGRLLRGAAAMGADHPDRSPATTTLRSRRQASIT